MADTCDTCGGPGYLLGLCRKHYYARTLADDEPGALTPRPGPGAHNRGPATNGPTRTRGARTVRCLYGFIGDDGCRGCLVCGQRTATPLATACALPDA